MPCRGLQGAKWSEHIAAWNPAASAAPTKAQQLARGQLLMRGVVADHQPDRAHWACASLLDLVLSRL